MKKLLLCILTLVGITLAGSLFAETPATTQQTNSHGYYSSITPSKKLVTAAHIPYTKIRILNFTSETIYSSVYDPNRNNPYPERWKYDQILPDYTNVITNDDPAFWETYLGLSDARQYEFVRIRVCPKAVVVVGPYASSSSVMIDTLFCG